MTDVVRCRGLHREGVCCERLRLTDKTGRDRRHGPQDVRSSMEVRHCSLQSGRQVLVGGNRLRMSSLPHLLRLPMQEGDIVPHRRDGFVQAYLQVAHHRGREIGFTQSFIETRRPMADGDCSAMGGRRQLSRIHQVDDTMMEIIVERTTKVLPTVDIGHQGRVKGVGAFMQHGRNGSGVDGRRPSGHIPSSRDVRVFWKHDNILTINK